jgi:hypothetical protein
MIRRVEMTRQSRDLVLESLDRTNSFESLGFREVSLRRSWSTCSGGECGSVREILRTCSDAQYRTAATRLSRLNWPIFIGVS